MVDFTRSLKFPFQDEEWVTKILVGGLLNLLPIVNFLSMGFALETMRNGTRGQEEMPEWQDWGDKFMLGLIAFVIGFIYSLIPVIIMTAGGAGGVLAGGLAGGGLFGGSALIGILLWLAIIFFMPMAMANYVAKQQFGAAFALGEILEHIKPVLGNYAIAYVLALVLAFFLVLVAFIPVIGWIIAIFGSFYVGVVFASVFGQLYGLAGSEN